MKKKHGLGFDADGDDLEALNEGGGRKRGGGNFAEAVAGRRRGDGDGDGEGEEGAWRAPGGLERIHVRREVLLRSDERGVAG